MPFTRAGACPCEAGFEPLEWRKPSSFQELLEAFTEGEVAHDDDGDCVTEIWTTKEAESSTMAMERLDDYTSERPDKWWETLLCYKVGSNPEVYFRPLDFFNIPNVYEPIPAVTPEEEASAIASILGTIEA